MVVRELLTQAIERANDISRGADASQRDLNFALKVFQGRIKKYSDNNLMSLSQKTKDFVVTKPIMVVGDWTLKPQYNLVADYDFFSGEEPPFSTTDSGEYVRNHDFIICRHASTQDGIKTILLTPSTTAVWVEVDDPTPYIQNDAVIEDMERIVSVGIPDDANYCNKLNYRNLADYEFDVNEYIYNVMPIGKNLCELRLKPRWDGRNVRVIYNSKMEWYLEKELYLPEVYEELLITAVEVELLRGDNDADPRQLAEAKQELENLENQIESNNVSIKMIQRSQYNGRDRFEDLITGAFITRRFG